MSERSHSTNRPQSSTVPSRTAAMLFLPILLLACTTIDTPAGTPAARDSNQQADCIDDKRMQAIVDEYKANEVRANKKYGGKRLCFRRTIARISDEGIRLEIRSDHRFRFTRFSIPAEEAGDLLLSLSAGNSLETSCRFTYDDFFGDPRLSHCRPEN